MTEETTTLPATNGRRPRGRAVPEPERNVTLHFEVPGPDEPGFIRRQKEALHHLDIMRGRRRDVLDNPVPAGEADMDNLIAFLLRFTTLEGDATAVTALFAEKMGTQAELNDTEKRTAVARELLMDITRAEYYRLLNAITQESDDFLLPPRRSASSANGTADSPVAPHSGASS